MSEVDDDDLLNRHRWVRIMCDVSADGVWDLEGRACDSDDLPIAPDLIERIRCWQEHYEAIENSLEDGRDGNWQAFSAEGFAIARAVKAALPDWTVIYFDEASACTVPFDDRRRRITEYEYEITLNRERHEQASNTLARLNAVPTTPRNKRRANFKHSKAAP